jgi:periplasmic protein TonB
MASSSPVVSPWARGHSWRVPVADLPWRRLPWILPVAIALWLLALWGFGRFMTSPASSPPEAPPLDAQIIELPPPEPPAAPPRLPEPPVLKPQPALPKIQAAPPQPTPPKTSLPADPAPSPATPVNPLPAPPPRPAPQPAAQTSGSPNQGRTGAYALAKPEPKIPDDLADDDARYNLSIKFNIGADGLFTVELVNPTPNPRLNRLYLDTVKNYKFFPATEDGKPVASSLTIRFTHNK